MILEIVRQVIEDMDLENRGATLYYALDPYDIVSYCFPVGPGERSARNLDEIADEQAAFYEVASTRVPAPVILEEYADEIDSILDFLKVHVGEAYDQSRTLAALIKQVRDKRSGLEQSIVDGLKKKEDPSPQDFNVVLAVVLGIYKLGSERFQDLFDRVSELLDPNVKQILSEVAAEYQENEDTEWLKNKIRKVVPRKKQGSAEDDARAIDRLFFLNNRLESAYLKKRLLNRHIFLYMSSAGRSAEIFGLPDVQARFPVIDGKRFSLHRLPQHVFTRLVNRGPSEDPEKNLAESLEKLRSVEDLLRRDRINQLNRKLSTQMQPWCTKCLLEDGPESAYANCPSLATCRAMYELRERVNTQRARTIQNLSLMSAAKRYLELLTARAGSVEEQRFLDFFIGVAEDETLRTRNDERIRQVNRLIKLQINFRNFLPAPRVVSNNVLTPQDRRVLHLFPLFTKAHDRYRDVFARLADSENALTLEEKVTQYEEALTAFTAIDAPSEVISEPHELVRSIVYLDCPTEAGDILAFEHAQEMLDNYTTYKREFWLVLALVAPRLRRFDDGEWYANQGLSHHLDDPRLHYARARNFVAWIRAIPDDPLREKRRELAISEQHECIRLCSKPNSPYRYLRALGHNNLAYFYCFNDSHVELNEEDLQRARENLSKLKEEINKSKWPAEGINFFHTEALVEWHEAAAFRRAGELEKAQFKLSCAHREIAFAVSRRPKEMYKQLQQLIEAELEALSRENAGTGQSLGPIA
jgi:hypothetical protein